jgi:hypothetical protein
VVQWAISGGWVHLSPVGVSTGEKGLRGIGIISLGIEEGSMMGGQRGDGGVWHFAWVRAKEESVA